MTTTTAPRPKAKTAPAARPGWISRAFTAGAKRVQARAVERGRFEHAVWRTLHNAGIESPTREQRAWVIGKVRAGKSQAAEDYWRRRARLSSRVGRGLGRAAVRSGRGIGWLSIRGWRLGRRGGRAAWRRIEPRWQAVGQSWFDAEVSRSQARAQRPHTPLWRRGWTVDVGGTRVPRWRAGDAFRARYRPADGWGAPSTAAPAPTASPSTGPVVPVHVNPAPPAPDPSLDHVPAPTPLRDRRPPAGPAPGADPRLLRRLAAWKPQLDKHRENVVSNSNVIASHTGFGERAPRGVTEIQDMGAEMEQAAVAFHQSVEVHHGNVTRGTAEMRGRRLEPSVTQHLQRAMESLEAAGTAFGLYMAAFEDTYGEAIRKARDETTLSTEWLADEAS